MKTSFLLICFLFAGNSHLLANDKSCSEIYNGQKHIYSSGTSVLVTYPYNVTFYLDTDRQPDNFFFEKIEYGDFACQIVNFNKISSSCLSFVVKWQAGSDKSWCDIDLIDKSSRNVVNSSRLFMDY